MNLDKNIDHKNKRSGESVDHLLLHCSFAQELWSMVFGLNGVQWVMSCWVLDLLTSWLGNLGWPRALVVWRVVPHCVMFVFGERGMLDILRIVREIHFRVQIVVFPNII